MMITSWPKPMPEVMLISLFNLQCIKELDHSLGHKTRPEKIIIKYWLYCESANTNQLSVHGFYFIRLCLSHPVVLCETRYQEKKLWNPTALYHIVYNGEIINIEWMNEDGPGNLITLVKVITDWCKVTQWKELWWIYVHI